MVLPEWLADPGLKPLWSAAAERLERRSLEPEGRVTITELDRAGRHALSSLLGRPVVRERVRVDLAQLDALLRERSGLGGLRAVCELTLGRKLRDRAADRSAASAARAAPFTIARDWLDQHAPRASWTEQWFAAVRRSGVLTRLPDPPGALLAATRLLVERTSEPTPISRTELAVQHTGDAHALDDASPLGQLVLRGLAVAAGMELTGSAVARRAVWERFSVAPDAVSSTCLALGLKSTGDGSCAQRLRMAASAGDPVHLTTWDLRQLRLATASTVLVCENPRVLEAFAERRGGAVPVVCGMGEPISLTLDVLRMLREGGASLRYHGDFDWPGIAIANRLVARHGVTPWRMGADDYLAAVRPDGPSLTGSPVTPEWDPRLGHAMRRTGIAVHEEALLDTLLTCEW